MQTHCRNPMFSMVGPFLSFLFSYLPRKRGYSWSKLLWIFNISLSPLEQNLFPCSANPELFLPPLVLRGWWVCLEGLQPSRLTVNPPLEWEGEEVRLWMQGGDKIPPQLTGQRSCDGESFSPHPPWLCAGDGRMSLGVTLAREIKLHRQDHPIHHGYLCPKKLQRLQPNGAMGSGTCGLWAAGTWNPGHKPRWYSTQSIYI